MAYGSTTPLQINIRQLRKKRGLTLDQLASRVGASKSYLSEVERGVKNLNSRLIAKVAEALEVSPSLLIGEMEASEPLEKVEAPVAAGQEHPFVTKLRERIGSDPALTASGLAKRAGLNARAVHDLLERRAACPRLDTAEKLCAALGTSLSEFLEGKAENDRALVEDEQKLLNMFRRLNDAEGAALLMHMVGVLSGSIRRG